MRRLDVLKVDAAESGGDALYSLAELLRVLLRNLDVEHVDAAVNLEKKSLALHHGLAGHCSDVSETQHRRAV